MNAVLEKPNGVVEHRAEWETPEKIKLVREIAAKHCTDAEFQMLVYVAKQYNLNPLLKEVFAQKYKNKRTGEWSPASIIVTRDGFVSIAHQTGDFEAMQSRVEVVQMPINRNGVQRGWQYKGICSIYRKGAEHPFVFEAYEDEYNSNTNVWSDKPKTMIMKVAESQGLRKAFKLNGLYTEDEMPPADDHEKTPEGHNPPALTEAQAAWEAEERRIYALTDELKAFFRWYVVREKWGKNEWRGKMLKIMTDNQDDPEALLSFARDNGWQGTAELSDVAKDDKMLGGQ